MSLIPVPTHSLRLSLSVFAMAVLFPALLSAQCAVEYSDSTTDTDITQVYGWGVLTDYYTDGVSGCGGSMASFVHTDNVTVTIYSPSNRTSSSSNWGSISSGSGVGSVRADAILSVQGEMGDYLIRSDVRIDCSVAGYGFYTATAYADI